MSGRDLLRKAVLLFLALLALGVWTLGVVLISEAHTWTGGAVVLAGVVLFALAVGLWRDDGRGALAGVIEGISEFFNT
jgi:hypothetical protein